MKKLMMLICIVSVGFMQAQDTKPKYEVDGDLVKVTYFYKNGNVHKQGYFKDTRPTGQWIQYDVAGNKQVIGQYLAGKKVGKWFLFSKDKLKEVDYANNAIVNVKVWKEETQVALN